MTTPPAPANDATRVLCAAVLANASFGNVVFRVLCVPRVRTMAPSPGIDLVVLARHAAWAFHVRRHRANTMSALLGLALVAIPLAALSPGLGALVATGSLGWSLLWSIGQDRGLAQAATRIIDQGIDPDLGTGLLADADEQRLAAVNDANLAIYSPAVDKNPFPGVGQRVNARLMPTFDIARKRDPAHTARAFTTSELLEHLARQLPKHIAVTNVADSRRARMVMYVRGTTVDSIAELLPDPKGPPVSKARSALLRLVADRPGSEVRTYLRAQVVGHGGHVVVTFHITAVTSPVGLSLDFTLHVLRPINPHFYEVDRIPRTSGWLTWHLLTQGGLWRDLLYAPGAAWRAAGMLGEAATPAQLTRSQLKAVGAHDFYGAPTGLREATSLFTEFGFNERNDADRQFNEIITAIFRELVEFLESHNIDPYQLLEERAEFIQNITNEFHNTINGPYHEGINAGGNVTIGGNVQANAQNFPNLQQAVVP